jgi:hypothetical protein
MKPIELEIENLPVITYAKDQPEYQPLPCVKLPNGDIATRWELTEAERDAIWNSKEFYLVMSTFNRPLTPVLPMADKPRVAFDDNKQPFFYSLLDWNAQSGIVESELYDTGLPAGFRDAVINDIHVHFGFWDRLKILFGWKVDIRSKTYTQQRPGNLQSETTVSVYRPRKLSEGWGVVESAPLEETDVER